MMLQLTIGHSCTGCGECDKKLDGLREALQRGPIMVNPYNNDVDWFAISAALKVCGPGALQLDGMEKNV